MDISDSSADESPNLEDDAATKELEAKRALEEATQEQQDRLKQAEEVKKQRVGEKSPAMSAFRGAAAPAKPP